MFKLIVYKGFSKEFLASIDKPKALECSVEKMTDVLNFDRAFSKMLTTSIYSIDDGEAVWITYEEFSLAYDAVLSNMEHYGLEVEVIKNNIYPDYYPLNFSMESALETELVDLFETTSLKKGSTLANIYMRVYSSLIRIGEKLYCSYNNIELGNSRIVVKDYYSEKATLSSGLKNDYILFLNADYEKYLNNLEEIKQLSPKVIGIRSDDSSISRRIFDSLCTYAKVNGISLVDSHELLEEEYDKEQELIAIARDEVKIRGFQNFRNIKFYKDPDCSNETILISQGKIIRDIVDQAEKANDISDNSKYRDIFITAPTGAGKSVMFQIPAVYIAKKYHKLTIIIEPVKALMQDQKEALNRNGYYRVEAFNSDLITQTEKEDVLRRVREGEVDLLYLSPETLLSYQIETIIGDRDIGLLIVDEAHIVTTWGVGFRPDYWYLGSYINRLRKKKTVYGALKQKSYSFPICAFTATAINGGIDNTVSETVTSLYMENPIKYIGYVKRDDIKFNIQLKDQTKLPNNEYEKRKMLDLDAHLKEWIENNEKTIVYFPYASNAFDAYNGRKSFAGIYVDHEKIGIYTGRNIDEISAEAFSQTKRETFERFKNGEIVVMFATKAFGMGIDINDVKNVYHYAASGNLNDYIQEIGRAARKEDMTGYALTDNYFNDSFFMQKLFGMSQIRDYQVKKVLNEIHQVYKNKNMRNFLIAPESFSYIFDSRKSGNESQSINKLKTTLLMIEKDLYEKYNFPVLISRPRSVFTRAFVQVKEVDESILLSSKYSRFFKQIESYSAKTELWEENGVITKKSKAAGKIYEVDLKGLWENYYQNLSFPAFKFWYFNFDSSSKENPHIMDRIHKYIYPCQELKIKTKSGIPLGELKSKILEDFEYIGNELYSKYSHSTWFKTEEFQKLLSYRYGRQKALVIANSLFEIVDSSEKCVKTKLVEAIGKKEYLISNGNFKELMLAPIKQSEFLFELNGNVDQAYSKYIPMDDKDTTVALKLLSIFDYISYEINGGAEPEIFIRLNDPAKIAGIVNGTIRYNNGYTKRARDKHERDVNVLDKFFTKLSTDEERWDFVERYFLGQNVSKLDVDDSQSEKIPMSKCIVQEESYSTEGMTGWKEISQLYLDDQIEMIRNLDSASIPIPEFLQTSIKNTAINDDVLLSWPSKDVMVVSDGISDDSYDICIKRGWKVYKASEIDYEKLEMDVRN